MDVNNWRRSDWTRILTNRDELKTFFSQVELSQMASSQSVQKPFIPPFKARVLIQS